MNTEQTQQINSDSSEQTEQLAEKLAASLRGGEVIELTSDLGGGKTTFARGLARGLGSSDHVSSPTFKIMNQYQGKTLTMYHYDFYRLHDDSLIEHELQDALDDPQGVVVIEWGSNISPLTRPVITIELRRITNDEREITMRVPPAYNYVFGKKGQL